MKVEITTTARGVEVASYVLAHALRALENPAVQRGMQLTPRDVDAAGRFRRRLTAALLRARQESEKQKRK